MYVCVCVCVCVCVFAGSSREYDRVAAVGLLGEMALVVFVCGVCVCVCACGVCRGGGVTYVYDCMYVSLCVCVCVCVCVYQDGSREYDRVAVVSLVIGLWCECLCVYTMVNYQILGARSAAFGVVSRVDRRCLAPA